MTPEDEKLMDEFLRKAHPALKKPHMPDVPPRLEAAFEKFLQEQFPEVTELTIMQMEALLLRILAGRAMDAVQLTSALKEKRIEIKDAGPGVILGLLSQLEVGGKVSSEWRDGNERRIKTYRATESGRQTLAGNEAPESITSRLAAAVLALSPR